MLKYFPNHTLIFNSGHLFELLLNFSTLSLTLDPFGYIIGSQYDICNDFSHWWSDFEQVSNFMTFLSLMTYKINISVNNNYHYVGNKNPYILSAHSLIYDHYLQSYSTFCFPYPKIWTKKLTRVPVLSRWFLPLSCESWIALWLFCILWTYIYQKNIVRLCHPRWYQLVEFWGLAHGLNHHPR